MTDLGTQRNYIKGLILVPYLLDYVCVEKTINNSVDNKFKDPCNSLICSDLRFKVVVPQGISYSQ